MAKKKIEQEDIFVLDANEKEIPNFKIIIKIGEEKTVKEFDCLEIYSAAQTGGILVKMRDDNGKIVIGEDGKPRCCLAVKQAGDNPEDVGRATEEMVKIGRELFDLPEGTFGYDHVMTVWGKFFEHIAKYEESGEAENIQEKSKKNL